MTRTEYKQFQWNKTHRININNIVERQCTQCEEWLEEDSNFYLQNKSHPEKGFSPWCKKCTSDSANKRQKANYPKYKKLQYNWREKDENQGKISQTAREWREDHQEWKQQYQLDYQHKYPEKMARYRIDKEMHRTHDILKPEWDNCQKYFDYKCAYCGLPLAEHWIRYRGKIMLGSFHKEHAIHNGGNGLDNCLPSCKSCNDKKWKRDLNEWYNNKNNKYTEDRYNKIIQWLMEDCFQYIMEHKPKRKYVRKKSL